MPSGLESKFALLWKAAAGPELVPEYRFAPPRRWRFDFAHIESRVSIEIEGGTWNGGRHTRGRGFEADCEKYNTATLNGWRVFRLTANMITHEWVERIVGFLKWRQSK